jgi:hypothetical protein
MNDNGQRLLELCTSHKLCCLPSSFFEGSMWSKMTWQHPHSKHWHLLDHVFIQKTHLQDLTHVRSMHSADCDTDVSLVRCKIKLKPMRIHMSRPKPSPTLDVLATKSKENCQQFQASLQANFVLSSPTQDATSAWLRFHNIVSDCALSSFGRRTQKQPDWFRCHADTLFPLLAEKRAAQLAVKKDTSPRTIAHRKQRCFHRMGFHRKSS